jgi:DNA polymerase (family 10)
MERLQVNNRELAQVFSNIADLLAIRGADARRVLAYRRAAENLETLGQEASEIWREGKLKQIPGVGAAIAAKIDELLSSGELTFYDELTAEVPASLLEVLKVSDIGPKRAGLFWRELDIKTVDQLAKAAKAGRLQTLPGIGARTETRILENIRALRRRESDRMLIGDAWPLASDLLARLRDVPGVTAAEAGGSMRRWRETVGDIDLVVAAKDRAALMDAFLTFPEIMRVLGRGETKASVELVSGLRAQLWVHPPKHFGTALQYATGSQAHNVRLRELARTKDLSLSEHAFTRPDGSQIHCKDEERVYKTLGLPWIPPELREDRGEIEAAVEGALPDLITPEQVVGDLQSHSTWSDGTASILEMAQAASEQGYEYLAITDHSRSLGVARGLTIERLKEQRQEIAEAQRILGEEFHLLHGTEVEVLADGSLDFPDDVLAELDIVVASIHSSLRQPRERITERMLAAIRNPHVDVIGHPSGRIIGRRDPADLDMERVFQAGAEAGIALEINAHPDRLDLKDVHARRAMELGCLLSINTDAHRPEHFAVRIYGVGVARRAWLAAENVINTWPLERLRRWLKARG